jgi:hypothetical protein
LKNKIISLALIAGLTACSGGNPFDTVVVEEEDTTIGEPTDGEIVGDGEGTGINRDGIPPGTTTPTPEDSIFRSEPAGTEGGVDEGDGFATGISYDSDDDTFTVDNLAFDGDRPYDRGTLVSSLSANDAGIGRFQVYEGPTTAIDPRSISDDNPTGEVRQFVYRAVYGVSNNTFTNTAGEQQATTQFAIVRTGSYTDYGFGGFIYQRDTSVELPTTGVATFNGHSAGLRDFQDGGGLQYTTADVKVNIDFSDFNDGESIRGDGVSGSITNREIFDLEGNNITSTVAAALGEDVTAIPNALFVVGPDVLDNNGDLIVDIRSDLPNGGGIYETGTFYAIVSGDADEITGVFVLEAESGSDSLSRDTGGFILYRGSEGE